MKNVVGISEIVLWTADKERALHFYRDLLGLEVISPPTLQNVFLKVGEGHAGIPQMVVLVPKTDEVKALGIKDDRGTTGEEEKAKDKEPPKDKDKEQPKEKG